jgi:hypothetical protein
VNRYASMNSQVICLVLDKVSAILWTTPLTFFSRVLMG